jgi:hypothetical protein
MERQQLASHLQHPPHVPALLLLLHQCQIANCSCKLAATVQETHLQMDQYQLGNLRLLFPHRSNGCTSDRYSRQQAVLQANTQPPWVPHHM